MSKYVGNILTDGAATGYSCGFNGSSTSLSVADNAAFEFGSGDFTIEAWVYTANAATRQTIIAKTNSGGNDASSAFVWQIGKSGAETTGLLNFYHSAATTYITASTALSSNTWYHIAIVRYGNTFTQYINGTANGTASTSTAIRDIPEGVYMGAGLYGVYFNGAISNLRIVKGTAVYTGNFTPPTQLFAITNTSLLTCQQPTIIDTSSNAFAITNTGGVTVSNFSPFPAYQSVPTGRYANNKAPGIWSLNDAAYFVKQENWPTQGAYDLYVEPAVYSSVTGTNVNYWVFSTHGNLVLSTAGQYTVSPQVTIYKSVRMWGSGGAPVTQTTAGWGGGGPAGSAVGIVSFVKGSTYIIRVPSAGANGSAPATCYGGGTGGGVFSVGTSGSGGGYAGIFLASVSQANAILMAAGGGGGASNRADGRGGRAGLGGGGTAGQGGDLGFYGGSGTQSSGGTATSPGSAGSALQGGSGGGGGGGGGGGYFGGGGGGTQGDGGKGGGGGSGYFNSTYVSGATLYTASTADLNVVSPAANNTDPYYASGVGVGARAAAGPSGPGLVVIVA